MRLTVRELDVVRLVGGKGYGPRKVARELGLSTFTVQTHIRTIGGRLRSLYPEYRPRERIIVFFREFLLKGETPPDVLDILAAALVLAREQ